MKGEVLVLVVQTFEEFENNAMETEFGPGMVEAAESAVFLGAVVALIVISALVVLMLVSKFSR